MWGPGPSRGLSSASLIHADTCVALSTHRATCGERRLHADAGVPPLGPGSLGLRSASSLARRGRGRGQGAGRQGRLQPGGSAGHLLPPTWLARLPFSCVSRQMATRAESGVGPACGAPVYLSGAFWSAWGSCSGRGAPLITWSSQGDGCGVGMCRSGRETPWRRCSVPLELDLWVP